MMVTCASLTRALQQLICNRKMDLLANNRML
ncbi:hypothetical protein PSAC2689_10055 [Paraburkholderia sacchari]